MAVHARTSSVVQQGKEERILRKATSKYHCFFLSETLIASLNQATHASQFKQPSSHLRTMYAGYIKPPQTIFFLLSLASGRVVVYQQSCSASQAKIIKQQLPNILRA